MKKSLDISDIVLCKIRSYSKPYPGEKVADNCSYYNGKYININCFLTHVSTLLKVHIKHKKIYFTVHILKHCFNILWHFTLILTNILNT